MCFRLSCVVSVDRTFVCIDFNTHRTLGAEIKRCHRIWKLVGWERISFSRSHSKIRDTSSASLVFFFFYFVVFQSWNQIGKRNTNKNYAKKSEMNEDKNMKKKRKKKQEDRMGKCDERWQTLQWTNFAACIYAVTKKCKRNPKTRNLVLWKMITFISALVRQLFPNSSLPCYCFIVKCSVPFRGVLFFS